MKADQIGLAAMLLGAGRATKDDTVNHGTGIVLHKKVGDSVAKGESLLTIHSDTKQIDQVIQKLYQNVTIAECADQPKLIHQIIN